MKKILLLFSSLLCMSQALAKQPNVIIVLADDMGWNDIGYHNSEVQTPNIDKLAKQGIELGHFYVNPTCSPTRASLMTGLFTTSHGVNAPVQSHSGIGIPLSSKILPQYFRDAGYTTHMAGKWHLGHRNKSYLPNARGFDTFLGHVGGGVGYYDHVWDGGIDWQRDGVTEHNQDYTTDLITSEAVRVIEQRTEKPIFLYVSFNAPHTPIEGPKQNPRSSDRTEHEGRITYLEMVTSLDSGVGEIIAALERERIANDTLVIFASDNGGQEPRSAIVNFFIPIARDAFASNDPLKGSKGEVYEGGVRVPATIWWPGRFESDAVLEQPMHIADLLPTLAEIVGLDLVDAEPGFHGESQLRALTSLEAQPRSPFIVANFGSEALIDWPFKLVKEVSLPFVPDLFKSEDYYLYNLALDPYEATDIAGSHPHTFNLMFELLQRMDRVSVVELDFSEGIETSGGEITRPTWAESIRAKPD
jgi:arylsulfatase A-like enzyme